MDEAGFRHGIKLFNAGDFFEAHEVLEDVWRAAPLPEKRFLQGLIQIAVAFVHYQRGNLVGAKSLSARGSRNLSQYGEEFHMLQIGQLLTRVAQWRTALQEQRALPPFPRIRLARGSDVPR